MLPEVNVLRINPLQKLGVYSSSRDCYMTRVFDPGGISRKALKNEKPHSLATAMLTLVLMSGIKIGLCG